MNSKKKKRARQFWEWLRDNAARMRNEYEAWFEEYARITEVSEGDGLTKLAPPHQEVVPAVSEIFAKLNEMGLRGLDVVVGPPRAEKRELVIGPAGRRKDLDLAIDLHACCKDIEIPAWEVVAFFPANGIPASRQMVFTHPGLTARIYLDEARFHTKPSTQHNDQLDVYFLLPQRPDATSDDALLLTLLKVLDALLGEYIVMKWVGAVSEGRPHPSHPDLGQPIEELAAVYDQWTRLSPQDRAAKQAVQRNREAKALGS